MASSPMPYTLVPCTSSLEISLRSGCEVAFAMTYSWIVVFKATSVTNESSETRRCTGHALLSKLFDLWPDERNLWIREPGSAERMAFRHVALFGEPTPKNQIAHPKESTMSRLLIGTGISLI